MTTPRGADGAKMVRPAHGEGPDWEFEAAGRALIHRPRVSIRLRLSVGLALCFLLCAAVVWTSKGVRPATPAGAAFADGVPLLLLALLFLAFLAIAFLFDRALMGPIRRFEAYTSRVARGDFSPIGPTRWYRDEFTDLALAVNSMLRELEAQQNQMVQAAKLTTVGTLTSGIAHELNNPLNNIAITTEALMEGSKRLSEEERWKLLQDVYFETERAGEIVKSLLDFTREERSESVPVSLVEVVESTRRLLHNEMELSGVKFTAEIPGDLPTVRGAVNPLRQVFLNLFINAVHAMPHGGTLSIRAHLTDEERVCVDVADTGTGIPAEVLPRIFDPFFTTKEPGKGTGLGLSVSLGILRKHGGEMRVVSEVGRGTTFHVCLPVLEAPVR
jgi:signal transduction histidine kinase